RRLPAPRATRERARRGARAAGVAADGGQRRMTPGTLPVLAVVIATRGGRSLGTALDAVAWASERAVLDPTGELGGELPPGLALRRGAACAAALGRAPGAP